MSDVAADRDADAERRDVRAAVRSGLAVAFATALYGVSFGALSVASGLDVWQTVFLSLVMFTGGSQFALIGILASGGAAAGPTAVATAALLGSRNTLYGMRMAPVVGRGPWWQRVLAPQLTIDESTAVSLSQTRPKARRVGFWVTGVGVFIGWNITTFVGALIGDAIGDPRAWGLDAAAAAAFLGLLWPRLRRRQAAAVGVGAAVVAAVCTPIMMPGLPVLVAAVVAVLVGVFNWFGRADAEEAST